MESASWARSSERDPHRGAADWKENRGATGREREKEKEKEVESRQGARERERERGSEPVFAETKTESAERHTERARSGHSHESERVGSVYTTATRDKRT